MNDFTKLCKDFVILQKELKIARKKKFEQRDFQEYLVLEKITFDAYSKLLLKIEELNELLKKDEKLKSILKMNDYDFMFDGEIHLGTFRKFVKRVDFESLNF